VCVFLYIISLSNSDDNNNNQRGRLDRGGGGHIESATAGHFFVVVVWLYLFLGLICLFICSFFLFSFSSWTGNE
jgi:Flp pilus assembly protein TadB